MLENLPLIEEKNQNCYFHKNLIPYIEKRLDDKLIKFMERHFFTCAYCLNEREKYQKILMTLSHSIPQVKMREHFLEEIKNEISMAMDNFILIQEREIHPLRLSIKEKIIEWLFKSEFLSYLFSFLFLSLIFTLIITLR